MNNIDIIKEKATTGLFTDYFDTKNIEYKFVGDLKFNNPKDFLLGPCKTIKCQSGPYKEENIELGLGYLDLCNPGDVLVVEGSDKFAYFGELMSRLSENRRLNGAIILGATRDVRFTGNHVTVAAESYMPVDIKGRGRVSEVGTEIKYGINENMWVAADVDGAVFFNESIIYDILDDLIELIKHEEMLVEKINNGYSVEEILKVTKGF
jgi:regulator of RNase E activity RraA